MFKWLKKLFTPCSWRVIDCWVARDGEGPSFFHEREPFLVNGGYVSGTVLGVCSSKPLAGPDEKRRCKILIEE